MIWDFQLIASRMTEPFKNLPHKKLENASFVKTISVEDHEKYALQT